MKFFSRVAFYSCMALSSALGCFCQAQANQSTSKPYTAIQMGEIFQNYRLLMPFIYSSQEQADVKEQNKVARLLDGLVKSSAKVSAHGVDLDTDDTYRHMARGFVSQLVKAKKYFDEGSIHAARFHLNGIVSNCVGCHTRHQDSKKRDRILNLFDLVEEEKLNFDERASFLIASRKFEEAKLLYEKAFQSLQTKKGKGSLDPFMLPKHLTEFLILSLQVTYSPQFVTKTLKSLKSSRQLPSYLDLQLSHWISYVNTLSNTNRPTLSVSQVVSLIGQEQFFTEGQVRFDQKDLAKAVIGASELNKILSDKGAKLKPDDRSTAYYFLGFLEKSMEANAFPTAMEYHFEKAITTNPKSQTADLAYKSLKEHIYFENTGSAGINVPKNQLKRLASLKKMTTL